MIRVVLVDDEALVRAGLGLVLRPEADIELVAEAGDGEAAVAAALAHVPDVVVMDVRMPVVDGLEATRRIVAAVPSARVLVLTTFGQERDVYAALQAGAAGFMLKDAPPEDLVAAIRAVARGDALLGAETTQLLVDAFVRRPPSPVADGAEGGASAAARLAGREREVVELVAAGCSNAEIAAAIGVTESTVKTHLARAQRKLGLRDRVHVVIWAYESGLVRGRAQATG